MKLSVVGFNSSPPGAFKLLAITASMIMLVIVDTTVLAQKFEIKRIELANQQVVIHYDLADSTVGRTYTVNVYASNDNYINPLQKLTGDLGMEVKPGYNKKIIWDAKSELGADYEGSVGLEIRGRLYIPFVYFSSFDEYKSFKRGKPYELTWSGGTSRNVLNFDLYRKDKKVATFANVANVGYYKMTLPKDTKPGKGYILRVSDTKNKNEVVYTSQFKVKRKTPLLLKIIPLAALGYMAYTFIGTSSDPEPEGPAKIIDPISPGGG